MNTKNNKRFKDMEIKLQSTLLRLMSTTDFDKITVTLICKTAHVNRSTFYAHFLDIYDMMEHMENYLSQELLFVYEDLFVSDTNILSSNLFLPLLHHIKKHQYFYKITIQYNHTFPLQYTLNSLLDEILKNKYLKAQASMEAEAIYYRTFLYYGITMVLQRWIETDCTESEEKMQKMFSLWINQ